MWTPTCIQPITGGNKFVWAYDLPVTANQMAVGAGGSGLYKFLDYNENLIATCRNHSLKDHYVQ